MDVDDLRSLYLNELQELCDCEAQVTLALPLMVVSAGSAELQLAIGQQAEQTVMHGRRVEAILFRHGTGPKADADQVAAALVQKAEQVASLAVDPDLRDAALIASVRRIEHHQIAAYTAAEGYAEALYLEIDRHSLLATLREEKITDRRFAALQSGANQLALLVSTPSY